MGSFLFCFKIIFQENIPRPERSQTDMAEAHLFFWPVGLENGPVTGCTLAFTGSWQIKQ